MTLEQLIMMVPIGSIVGGVWWYIRVRYGQVFQARADRDAEAVRDGRKR